MKIKYTQIDGNLVKVIYSEEQEVVFTLPKKAMAIIELSKEGGIN